MNEPTVVGMIANTRIAAIAHTLEQEQREQDRERAGVVRFATAKVTQLTTAVYGSEQSDKLGAAGAAQLYAPFETCIPRAIVLRAQRIDPQAL
jgi:hypothetical protein